MEENLSIIETKSIPISSDDNVINLVLYTLELKKQVLVFNNSKRSSQATAEKIAKFIKNSSIEVDELEKLSQKILKSLSSPTSQCKRLANVIKKGVAFHHSGLTAKQRNLIENSFKKGLIKVISSTPTLAVGLDLPAYKVIIKDYKRYSQRGFVDIPTLEFHQMSGRAGRPGKEDIGNAVLCIKSENDLDRITKKYIFGKPEEILSKLAVEPTLKMYILSLISMEITNTKEEIKNFFSKTLYSYQYKDDLGFEHNLFRILNILKEYDFVEQEDNFYVATPIGKKISQLYLNPDTAHYFLEYLDDFFKVFSTQTISKYDIFSLLYFISNTVEMKPLFRVSKAEYDDYVKKAEDLSDDLIIKFDPFEMDYDNYLSLIKISDIYQDWINEAPEDYICDKYNITPGEINYKIETMDWLLYALSELSHLKKEHYFKNFLNKFRIRIKYGVKEDLLAFLKFKGIGRVRARLLIRAGFNTINDLRRADFSSIERVVGTNLAASIKNEISENVSEKELLTTPTEIKLRNVSDEEVEKLIESNKIYEEEKKKIIEKQFNLNDYF